MERFRTPIVAGALVALAVGAAGCGAHHSSNPGGAYGSPASATSAASAAGQPGGASTSAAPATGATTITIKSFGFGAPLTVKPGQKIQVVNQDSVPHTVTSDDGTSFEAPAPPGSTTTFTAPTKAGTYAFHCEVHPDMHGTLIVL